MPAPPEHELAQGKRVDGGLQGEEPSRGVRGAGERPVCGRAASLGNTSNRHMSLCLLLAAMSVSSFSFVASLW